MSLDYLMITALVGIAMMLLLREANDLIFIYYQHLALPISLPIP